MSLRARLTPHQYGGSKLKTDATIEPVVAADLRTHMRLPATTPSDAELNALAKEARQMVEEITGLALINQSWELSLDGWPNVRPTPWWDGEVIGSLDELTTATGSVIEFPRYPLSSLTSVKVYDTAGTETTVSHATLFITDNYKNPARMTLKTGNTWPTATQNISAILIEYVAGYGAAASAVPEPIKLGLKNMIAYLYKHRGDDCSPFEAYSKSGCEGLLGLYSVVRI